MTDESRVGIGPLHRPKHWSREEIRMGKETKKTSWYKKENVFFVPCSPKEHLKKLYGQEVKKNGFKIQVEERSGIKVKDIVHKKDPFRRKLTMQDPTALCAYQDENRRKYAMKRTLRR